MTEQDGTRAGETKVWSSDRVVSRYYMFRVAH